MLYHRNGVAAAQLRPAETLVVGRAPGPGSHILAADDPSLSKIHARFLIEDGDVIVEDCESTNGTWLHGRSVERARISPGDMVRLGPAVFALLQGGAESLGAVQPIRHERFRYAVEDEILRARHFGRALALVMLRAEQDGVHVSQFLDAVTAHLRPIDRFAFYSPGTIEVLLPELRGEDAVVWAANVLAATGTPLLAGVVGYSKSAADPEKLVEKCRTALRGASPRRAVSFFDDARPVTPDSVAPGSDDTVVGSPALHAVLERAKRIAPSTLSILILGETGVGKEVLARQIHGWSSRSKKLFLPFNCGAIPPNLVESTLFGHVRGAFTDAKESKVGIFEEADGGTLLLDEIGELPRDAQTRLLRVLEEGEVVRVGASRGKHVDVRVLAATHCDLESMVKKGTFRKDLLYRLNQSVLQIPPLRDRRDEIPSLARRFLAREAGVNSKPVHDIAPAAMDCLLSYPWPGNVRELRNTIEQAVVLTLGEAVTVDDLPDRVRAAAPRSSVQPPPLSTQQHKGKSLPRSFRSAVESFEKQLLLETLDAYGGDREAAAKRLGLPLRTLAYTMKRLGIHLRPRSQQLRQRKAST